MSEKSAPASPSSRPKGSPAMIIILVVVLAPSLLIGSLVGAGGASIIGGFIALFGLLATMGGPLRADLRRFAAIGPLVAFSAVAPRLLAEVTVLGAFALITGLVFIAGLLPIRSRRYDSVALGVGMGALLGYSIPLTGPASAVQLVIAAVVGLAIALILRVLLGIGDPGGPTRKAIADLLDGTSSDFSAAFDSWLSDRPSRWLGRVLVSAGQYRISRRVLTGPVGSSEDEPDSVLEAEGDRAAVIAVSVRAKSRPPVDTPPDDNVSPAPESTDQLRSHALRSMTSALDDAKRAAEERDASTVPLPAGFRRRLSLSALRAGLRHGSVQVRHALRTALGALLALLVSLFLQPGDPLLPTLLVTTFVVIQTSWRATLSRARDRFAGLAIGGLLVVIIVLTVPESWFLPISLVGLAIGMWFVTARPAIGTAGIIVMSVGLNTELRHLEPWAVILEYVVLTIIALVIGTVVGFVVVPAWRPRPLPERIDTAVGLTARALRSLAADMGGQPEAVLRSLEDAQGAAQQLVPDREKLTVGQEHELDRLRFALQDLIVTTVFVVGSSSGPRRFAALDRAAGLLDGAAEAGDTSPDDSNPLGDAIPVLADEVARQRTRLDESLRI